MKKFTILLTVCLFSFINQAYTQAFINYDTLNSGIASNAVTSIAIDKDGNMWFGSEKGVSKFDGVNWTTYDTLAGLVNDGVNTIEIDAEGNKWFGTWGGVSKFDGTNWMSYTEKDGLVHNYVKDIAIDAEGNKWFGYSWFEFWDIGGVTKFDGTNWTTYTKKDGLVDDWVFAIAIDKEGNKWFGTLNGISKFDGTNWTNYGFAPYLPVQNNVNTITFDTEDNIWFGTWAGVLKFDGTNWTPYYGADGLTVLDIAIDKAGNKWFGIWGGVLKFDGTKLDTVIVPSTPPGIVMAIEIDAQGNIWCGTEKNGVIELLAGTEISPITNKSQLNLYPNPLSNIGTFDIENSCRQEVSLEIFDFSGRLIGEKISTAEKLEFDFSNYSSGIYFYRLKNSEKVIGTGKVIRE